MSREVVSGQNALKHCVCMLQLRPASLTCQVSAGQLGGLECCHGITIAQEYEGTMEQYLLVFDKSPGMCWASGRCVDYRIRMALC